ncbi:MAG: PSD1 and planctomycete cytochrome C domain-containing protein, partial [Planctomycetota bacterium]|nr:PSD1 and planctomycete cytochrome C domain-containing protein [Planctomycetota bacterium]
MNQLSCLRLRIAICIALFTAGSAAASETDYLKLVKPVLHERCFACHGALKQESGLRLDTVAFLKKGGDDGPVIIPGQAMNSPLVKRVSAHDESVRMPPEGLPLSKEQVLAITAWINSGASGPMGEEPEQDPQQHWAFQRPVRSAVPKVQRAGWNENPIDAFLAAEQECLALKIVAPVQRSLLLRRVYLDLIGLPPTRAQLETFLADNRPDAYKRVVDQLLKSPHHGERWGRNWMDIWRYTDWFGLGQQLRYSQKHIWHWRDWIIEAINADKSYDRMIVEMLAADEIAPTDRDTLRATGFLARSYFLFNRTTWLDNTIEHTAKAFLGLTMNCHKCHDHKYDPLTQVDYYRMRAFFEPHQVRLDPLPGQTNLEMDGLPRVFDAHPDAVTYLHIRGDEKNPDKNRKITPGVPAVLAFDELNLAEVQLPGIAHNPSLQPFVLQDHLRIVELAIEAERKKVDATRKEFDVAKATASKNVAPKPDANSKKPATPAAKPSPKTATADEGKVFLADDFSKSRPDAWITGPGKWSFADGVLKQSEAGATRKYLRTKSNHPRNFVAKLKFRTLGGNMWKSVGLAFDVAGDRESLVYMSSVQPGSKVQISYKTGAKHEYPPDGMQARPVKLNQLYELNFAIREQLMNVSIDGKHVLAFQLPVERRTGTMELIAFDAVVEFHDLEVRELADDVNLMPAAKPAAFAKTTAPKMLSVEQAAAKLAAAEAALKSVQSRTNALRTAHAADVAKNMDAESANTKSLVEAAARAARESELARAETALANAAFAVAIADAKSKAKAAETHKKAGDAVAKATLALKQPGTNYTSLQTSLKALEGPAESDAARRMPYPKVSTGRRTALARWIVDRRNPLTARVAVNHIWLRHFGQPLVESVADFGRRAPQPEQHKLLDWLAVEFMESGWSMKHMHRLMVTSQAYRLNTSTLDADESTRKADAANRYYWRRESARMESQLIRDSLLQLAGLLDPKLGGPTISPKGADTANRRSVYFTHSRDDQHPFVSMFDDADILQCYRRSESIIPQQALTLANSRISLSMARTIAANILKSIDQAKPVGEADDELIGAAFQTILARTPATDETEACREALIATRKTLAGRPKNEAASR